jgi:hypothetical protein
MAKVLISNLENQALDWAVAKCEGWFDNKVVIAISPTSIAWYDPRFDDGREDTPLPDYSTDWSHGGPIIEREKIQLGYIETFKEWGSFIQGGKRGTGNTPLIAAMRVYLASKHKEDFIEVPDELINSHTEAERQRG